MPKRGDDDDAGKGSKARAQKAAAAAQKDAAAAAAKERDEAAAWADGANTRALKKQQEAAEKAAADARKKAEKEQALKAEEEELAKARKLRGSDKVAARKAQAVADDHEAIERFNADGLEARNIDDAIAMLASSNLGSDGTNASGAGGAAGAGGSDDAHPEKRMKASFARFKERELPLIKAEYPSLRMTQHLDMLKRKWDKSPENPLVQAERAKAAEGAAWKEK